ncbi:hypothetical protein CDAR_214231 [Caerostris darwini]|uniref:Uncharacterized protein n=1 Tax=Caerostris darwini TaxID=1538125 RepID=A0AAV4S4G9_9ARAC|nr:hypothetical protein CDAR_214231 [Caerostris darwini]
MHPSVYPEQTNKNEGQAFIPCHQPLNLILLNPRSGSPPPQYKCPQHVGDRGWVDSFFTYFDDPEWNDGILESLNRLGALNSAMKVQLRFFQTYTNTFIPNEDDFREQFWPVDVVLQF